MACSVLLGDLQQENLLLLECQLRKSEDDALALVIAKLLHWPVSRAYLFTDLVVLLLSLTYIPLQNIACSLVTVTLSSFIIGKIHTLGKKDEATA